MNVSRARVLSQFQSLSNGLIDASSVIYMHKSGYLDILAGTLKLSAPPEVLAETGLDHKKIMSVSSDGKPDSVDHIFIRCALEHGWPVISDDKKILLRMERENLPYFNSLMMLNFLLFKRRIGKVGHSKYFQNLMKHARYGPEVLEFARSIYERIIEETL